VLGGTAPRQVLAQSSATGSGSADQATAGRQGQAAVARKLPHHRNRTSLNGIEEPDSSCEPSVQLIHELAEAVRHVRDVLPSTGSPSGASSSRNQKNTFP
jgi:hypothetical protein